MADNEKEISEGNSVDGKIPVEDVSPEENLGENLTTIREEMILETEPEDLQDYIPAPPDGGWGWVIVVASFMANMVVDGIAYSFGILLPELESAFGAPRGVTTMVGSLLTGCYLIVGPIVSGLVNSFGSRTVMIIGSFIGMAAFFGSYWAPSVTYLMVLYGIVGGIGFGLIYLPAIVHVGYYFEKKRALATGIAVAGSGVGTFIFAPLSVFLMEQYGWRGSLWIFAGFILNCAVCGAVLRPLKSKKDPKELEIKLRDEGLKVLNSLSQLDLNQIGSMQSLDPETIRRLGVMRGISSCSNSQSIYSHKFHRGSSAGYSVADEVIKLNANDPVEMAKMTRLRSALSECSNDASAASAPSPVPLDALEEEEDQENHERAGESQADSPLLENKEDGGGGGESGSKEPALNGQAGLMTPRSSRLPSISTKLTAQSFARSISRLNSMNTIAAARSITSLSSVQPKDFAKPLYRQDIFYGGSITNLPQFKASKSNIATYRESTISIPQVAAIEETDGFQVVAPMEEDVGPCSCLPSSVRNILFEMIGIGLLKEPVMVLLCLSNIFGMLGFYCPFVFLSSKAMDCGVDKEKASLLLSVIGITNTLGRVFFGWFSDRGWLSALTINNACLIISAILTALLPFFNSYGLMVMYSAIFGFIISAYISLTSIILVDHLGLDKLTNSFGLLILSRGIAAMAGSPVAGMVYDQTNSYDASFLYSAAMLLAAGLVSCLIGLIAKMKKWLRLDSFQEDPVENEPKEV